MNLLTISRSELEVLISKSLASPRKREFKCSRSSENGNIPGIILNVFQPGTYVRPHRHPMSDGKEIWIPIQGLIRAIIFDNDGNVADNFSISPSQNVYFEIPAGTYHSAIAEQPDSVLLELYQGIYNPTTYKAFPQWAPEEESPAADSYLSRLTRTRPSTQP